MNFVVSMVLLTVVVPAQAPAAPAKSTPLQDRFIDGSKQRGPPMQRIGPLSFEMGAQPNEPGYTRLQLRHHVELSAFAIGKYEVTNAEFVTFLNEVGNGESEQKPWVTFNMPGVLIRKRGKRFEAVKGAASRPVVGVTWPGARAYCAWLSRKTGHTYDLPTSAQWEAAARSGADTTWSWGNRDDPKRYHTRAEQSRAVGSFPPNGWGLHDMAGNVWEWVLDCFEPDFATFSPKRDPVMLNEACLTPEIRGSGFRDSAEMSRPGFRSNMWWGGADSIGFRVARVIEPATK